MEHIVQTTGATSVRIIGIIMATQTENEITGRNDRLSGVVVHFYAHADVESVTDMPTNLLDQVEEFFVSYNKQRKKKFQIKGLGGPKKAMQYLRLGLQSFKKAQKGKDKGCQSNLFFPRIYLDLAIHSASDRDVSYTLRLECAFLASTHQPEGASRSLMRNEAIMWADLSLRFLLGGAGERLSPSSLSWGMCFNRNVLPASSLPLRPSRSPRWGLPSSLMMALTPVSKVALCSWGLLPFSFIANWSAC
jgi:hypothetical protein